MHTVLMTFEFSGAERELRSVFERSAESADETRELVMKTWMQDGSTIGGFYVFKTAEAAERFLRSTTIHTLVAHPDASDVYVRLFTTIGDITITETERPELMPLADGDADEAAPVWHGDIDRIAAHIG